MADIVGEWLEKYRTAWASNEPDDIRALFTEDATYAGSPFSTDPWRGHDGIVAGWIEHADAPGDYTFEGAPLAYADGIGFVLPSRWEGETILRFAILHPDTTEAIIDEILVTLA